MHVKNGANQNMSNHKLTGAKCQLIHRFWLEILRKTHGITDTLLNMKITGYTHGLLELIHGVHVIVIQTQMLGFMQNWQRTVIKMKWNRHAIHVIRGVSIHPGLNEIVRVVNENAYLLGEAVKKIDDLSNELEELKGKLNNEH